MSGSADPVRVFRLELDGEVLGAEIDGERCTRRIDRTAIDTLVAELDAVLTRATRWGDEDQGSAAMCRRAGELLFDLVLPRPVKHALRGLQGGVVALHLDPTSPWLMSLPFELMHDGENTLGERFGLGRTIEEGSQAASPRAGGRALVICDPRGDLIGAYHEGLTVRDELCAMGFAVDLRSTEVTALDVLRLIRDYELVHFAGHGERSAGEYCGAARGWWLKDDVLTATMLTELAGGRPLPALVFSNACRSLAVDENGGLAAAMIKGGARHVIGTTHEVPDEVAALFALLVFEGLRAGVPVGVAVRDARLGLRARYGSSSVYGGAWVLFGDPYEVIRPALRVDEAAVTATPIHEVGLRLRGTTNGVAAPGAEVVAVVGATRGQLLLASVGAVALLALLVVMVLAALSGPEGQEETRAAPSGEIWRAHPVEHRAVQPLWGPP